MSRYVLIPWPTNHQISRLGRRIGVQDRYFERSIPSGSHFMLSALTAFAIASGAVWANVAAGQRTALNISTLSKLLFITVSLAGMLTS